MMTRALFTWLLVFVWASLAQAFLVGQPGIHTLTMTVRLFSSTPKEWTDVFPTKAAKKNLIDTARRLKDEYGTLLIDKQAKTDLRCAVEDLEKIGTVPQPGKITDVFLGNWTLICTTATNVDGIDTKQIPFINSGPLKELRDSLQRSTNKYLTVQQVVRSTNNDGVIDRIDHVLDYKPPTEFRDVFDNLPEQLSTLKINPLQVSDSKVVLIHKATIQSESPLVTKIALRSTVLNVAGTSTVLDPEGRDVAAINLPLGEFINAGEFETTYMDDTVRISRGKQGLVDQLRVFIRTEKLKEMDEASEDASDVDLIAEQDKEEPSDYYPSDINTT